jgi:hypothetical protein
MAILRLIEERLIARPPFPSISREGELRDGELYAHREVCRNCKPRACVKLYDITDGSVMHGACYRGVGVAGLQFGETRLVLNGLRLESEREKLSRSAKKEIRATPIGKDDVSKWFASIRDLAFSIVTITDESVRDSLAMFHDVQTSASAIMRNAEELLARLPGTTEEEKLASLPQAATSLIKSTDLLQRRLALMPLVVNPDAARFGVKRAVHVYKLLDVLVRTLRSTSEANRVSVYMRGTCFRSATVYSSFDTIPLVILENAIKYSQPGQDVEVEVVDARPSGVSVTITSFSPWIPPGERDHVFEKGFRGFNAAQVASQGAGIGLYLAKIVADAHGIAIRHITDDRDVRMNGIRYCQNSFTFTVP